VSELHSWITDEPISADTVLRRVTAAEHGAAVVFLGIVRDHNDGRPVRGIHYDAYREMAQQLLADIVAEAAMRVQPAQIAAVHRLGELAVGDVSIAIAVATPHRAEAFEACRYVIEGVKQRLTVWKQEHYLTGESTWVAGLEPQPEPPA
jgi:molybdopterin synthase catalytic subunit